jgi:hypothetical protein
VSLLALLRRAPAFPDRIEIDGRSIPVELRRSPRARRMTLRADAVQGVVRVTLPARAAEGRAAAFLADHHGWIAARVARWPSGRPFAPGETVPVEGEDLVIDWMPGRPRGVRIDAGRLIAGGPAEGLAGRIERFLRAEALRTLDAETRDVAAKIGKRIARVSVRDTASRWGSCSSSGAVAYSWRLILMPPHVRRSIVAHEVAHLVHMNHGAAFHALADQLYPHHATANRWLKRHGASVHWVGRG